MSLENFVSAQVDLGFLERARVALRNPDLRPAWKEARKPVRADQREHAKKQEGPGGTWPPRASSTKVRAASGRRRRTPRLLGRLPGAITTRTDRRRLLVRSLVKWAGVHQEGGRAGRGARIPARPFLWASDKVLETVAAIVVRTVTKVIVPQARVIRGGR